MSELQLSLTAAEAGAELELVAAEPVTSSAPIAPPAVLSPSPPPVPSALEEGNLFPQAERIAALRRLGEHAPALRGDLPRLR